MQTWTTREDEKREWGEGPWVQEPDKAQWVDAATNLDCLIVRNRMGSLCGYVGVPPGHPWHGCDYEKPDVSVHGGLSFADLCDEGATEEQGICHVPAPGRPADVWWLGFDCAHAFDLTPGLAARMRELDRLQPSHLPELPPNMGDVYRTFEYVRSEVTDLARQIADAAAPPDP